MKKQLRSFLFPLFLLALQPVTGQQAVKVPYITAKNYFAKNDVVIGEPGNTQTEARLITDKETLETYFGYATTMGSAGKPTTIDFSKQSAIAVIPVTGQGDLLTVKSLVKKGEELVLTYEKKPDPVKRTYTLKRFLLLVIDNKFNGRLTTVVQQKKQSLTVNPVEKEAAPEMVRFYSKAGTLFYFDNKTQTGGISINGTAYALTEYLFINNQGSGKKDGYRLSGNGVTISAPNLAPAKSSGGDCNYGTLPAVTIKLNGNMVVLKNVQVQDCPGF